MESFAKNLKICEKNINDSDLENSKIICKEDFSLVLEGINKNLKKSIKKVKLLYRASRDDHQNFIQNVMENKILSLL